MADELEFDPDEFMRGSHEQRIRLCRKLARRAEHKATIANGDQKDSLLKLAAEWDRLGDELQNQV